MRVGGLKGLYVEQMLDVKNVFFLVDYNLRSITFHIIICFVNSMLLIRTFILGWCPVKCIYPCSRLTSNLVVKPINLLYYLPHLHMVICGLNRQRLEMRLECWLLVYLFWGVLDFNIYRWLAKSWSILQIWWCLRIILV